MQIELHSTHPIRTQLAQYADQIRQKELGRSLKKVNSNDPYIALCFEQVAERIVAQLLSEPFRRLDAEQGEGMYTAVIADLFNFAEGMQTRCANTVIIGIE